MKLYFVVIHNYDETAVVMNCMFTDEESAVTFANVMLSRSAVRHVYIYPAEKDARLVIERKITS